LFWFATEEQRRQPPKTAPPAGLSVFGLGSVRCSKKCLPFVSFPTTVPFSF
jgi:hypothetical protein